MSHINITSKPQDKADPLFIVFSVWAFILVCRPQDYISIVAALRPSLTLGVTTLLMYLLKAKHSEMLYKDNQFKLFTYLILIMFAGVPFSYYRSASLSDVFSYASFNMTFYYIFCQIIDTNQKLNRILFALCAGIAIYAMYALKLGTVIEGRLKFGNMFDSNDITYLIISYIAFNMIFIKSGNKAQKTIAVTNVVISIIVIMKTGSRGGMLAISTMLAYFLFIKTNTISISFVKKAALTIMVILSLLYFVDMNSARYKTLLDVTEDYNITDEEGRLAIWKTGMRMILSRPLTGVGMNQFSQGVGRDREERGLSTAKWQAPHNSLVQIGAETGIFGLFFFILMSINVFRITTQVIKTSQIGTLVEVSEVTRVGFIGHLVSSFFLSQAYSIYWVFYVILSSVIKSLHDKEIKE